MYGHFIAIPFNKVNPRSCAGFTFGGLHFWLKHLFCKKKMSITLTHLAKFFLAHLFINRFWKKFRRILILWKYFFFLKMKYDLMSHRTTFKLWRGCVTFLLSDYLILWQPWLTFLWTTFVLVFCYSSL